MDRSHQLEAAIYHHVHRMSECTFEQLVDRLPQYGWNEVFHMVDRLSRQGRLALRHPTRFGFLISLPSGTGDAVSLPRDGRSGESPAAYRAIGS